jgi:hypothetical protein
LGNRRFVVVVALGALLISTLSGCSAVSSPTASEATAVAIGEQALVFTPPPMTGWSSAVTCPNSLEDGMLAGLPAGGTVTALDAATITGVPGDPQLTAGDTPSCAYTLTASGRTVTEVIFVGMGESYQATIVARLVAAGFAVTSTITIALGTEQVYSNGTAGVGIEKLQADGISVFGVVG